MLIVIVSNGFAMGIVLSEILQFYIQYGSLNLIKTAIATSILEYILPLTAICLLYTSPSPRD